MKSIRRDRTAIGLLIALAWVMVITSSQAAAQEFGTNPTNDHDLSSQDAEDIAGSRNQTKKRSVKINKMSDGTTQVISKKHPKLRANRDALLNKERSEILRLVRQIEKDLDTNFPGRLEFRVTLIDEIDPGFTGNSYYVVFHQYIDGIKSARSVIQLDSEFNVTDVVLHIFDPDHPNTNQKQWIDKQTAKQIAVASMVQNLSHGQQTIGFDENKVVHTSTLYIPLEIGQGDIELRPVYIFLYRAFDFEVIVDALTGQPEFRDVSFRAYNDTNTVTCVARTTVPTEVESCDVPVVETIFGEDSQGDPVCNIYADPKPSECYDTKFTRYLETINYLESWYPLFIDGNCCRDMGRYFQFLGSDFWMLNAVVLNNTADIGNSTRFVPHTKTMVIRRSDHDRSDASLKEIVAHEWGHAYLHGYARIHKENKTLAGSSNDFFMAFHEGISDYIAVTYSHSSGTDTDWQFADNLSRNISSNRQWSAPNADQHLSGRIFSNFFYRIATSGFSGVNEYRALQLAIYVARTLSMELAGDTRTLDINDFGHAVDQYTRGAYGSAALRRAACKSWYDMTMPSPFCQPEKPELTGGFMFCDRGEAYYYFNWSNNDIDSHFYALELFSHATDWFVDRWTGDEETYVYNSLTSEGRFRVQSCNDWYCTTSSDRFVGDVCQNPVD